MGKLQWMPWMALAGVARAAQGLSEVSTAPGECGYAWTPAADVVETALGFRVIMELPGVAREAVHVEAKGRCLVISGERCPAHETDDEGVYQLMERSYGPFLRRFVLPHDVAPQAVEAVLKDGVLTVLVRKALPESRHRRIPID